MTTLVLEIKKIESDDETTFSTCYLPSNAETIINGSDIDDVLESIYIEIVSNIQKSHGRGSSWIIDSVVDYTINISKCQP